MQTGIDSREAGRGRVGDAGRLACSCVMKDTELEKL